MADSSSLPERFDTEAGARILVDDRPDWRNFIKLANLSAILSAF
jgi:hypothetical protein